MHSVQAVAKRIRAKREGLGYSQEYLAYKLKVSQNSYSKIELGKVKITLEKLFAIAEVLNYDMVDLLGLDQAAGMSAVA